MVLSSAKLQIIEKMNSNGLLEFIKENEFYSLCHPYESLSCSYLDEDGFKYKRYDNEQHLNIFSMNIRSLPKHGVELLVFLQSLETKFDVIVLTEIGARNIGTLEHLLPNYDFYYTLPREKFYGGVGMYVSKSIGSIQAIDDLNFTKHVNIVNVLSRRCTSGLIMVKDHIYWEGCIGIKTAISNTLLRI